MMSPSYDALLVLFSLLVAVLASYTALDLTGRIATAHGVQAHVWLAGGATAMGFGIWSMHFVGMLAFRLPIPLAYDIGITMLSLAIAIGASAFALWLVCRENLPWQRLSGGALVLGGAVASMHYTGMAAMRIEPGIIYNPALFALSVMIAVAASGAALWIAFQLRRNMPRVHQLRLGAAVIMGGAIASMHYTGMAAAEFPLGSVCGAVGRGLPGESLALPILVITICVLAVALITSVLDMRLEMRTAIMAEALGAANQELEFLALHDKLTRLPNRALLDDRFNQAIQANVRQQGSFAVLFVDLDGFKGINDSYGHHVGDALLVEIAGRLRAIMQSEDTISRVGGDEFVLLARVDEPADAGVIAESLLAALREPVYVAGLTLHVSASIGIAVHPADGADQDALLTNADAAMYHAKASGRNAYFYFERSMNHQARAQQTLLQDLRGALKQGQLRLHYQPKYAAGNGALIGAEALLRWDHPVQGLLMPDQFIALAEKTGAIVPIGNWVLDEACRQLAVWHSAGQTSLSMAVNLSALQFCHAGMVEAVAEALANHRVPPSSLTLEITESTAMRDVETSLAILTRLDDMGVRIAIDDFGTGYSSLLHLKRIPASELKIDRGFVRELEEDSEDAAIVSAIVALGRTLNLQVVAEGVETDEQREFLAGLGCDALQGYLFGKPMPPEQFPSAPAAPRRAAAAATAAAAVCVVAAADTPVPFEGITHPA
ncbi:putative bifunctional diguanylate cyclase/phosphodiesterase [Cupriavidus plantarum]|uniref:putative bifunctional diguanylate cyclase/phosphodiesterase n=1 Tax=Cupriavidus plantarum TaxID=942865 RepID=UPI0015CCB5A2|nr:bifunctional diguanylate cyclase/phosphodiesterase [Cupriavidus plantarum]NYI00797.1 diguanylate cyclase (GGDEF)-like protein [Cupriavidus plantarum]